MGMGWHNLPKITKRKRRVGRGVGSKGAKSGRGMKGQKARAGFSRRAGFEGGQTPLYQRLPKDRGAKQRFRSPLFTSAAVRVEKLARFDDGEIVGLGKLVVAGLIDRRCRQVKLIGQGELKKKLTVRVQAVSRQARQVIEQAGGKVEIRTRQK